MVVEFYIYFSYEGLVVKEVDSTSTVNNSMTRPSPWIKHESFISTYLLMYKYFTHDNKELDFSISLYGFQCGCYTAVLRRRIRHV